MSNAAVLVDGVVHDFYSDGAHLVHVWQVPGGGWQSETLDNVGYDSDEIGPTVAATAVGAYPAVFYYDGGAGLRYAQLTASDGWVISTLDGHTQGPDPFDNVGDGVAVTLVDGNPFVFYNDRTTGSGRYARMISGQWEFGVVPESGNGQHAAITINGMPTVFSAFGSGLDSLWETWWDGAQWHSYMIPGEHDDSNPSVVLYQGEPHLFVITRSPYADLRHLWQTTKGWTSEILDGRDAPAGSGAIGDAIGGANSWQYTSAILVSGLPNVWYLDVGGVNSRLRHAAWDGHAWHLEFVDGQGLTAAGTIGGSVGGAPAAVTDASGQPDVFYEWDTGSNHSPFPGYPLREASLGEGLWNASTVECPQACPDPNVNPPTITPVGHRVAAVSVNGLLQAFTGGNSLTQSWFDGHDWHFATIEAGSPPPANSATPPRFSYVAASVVAGLPEVFYYDASYEVLKHAYWSGSKWVTEVLDGPGSQYTANGALPVGAGDGVASIVVDGVVHVFYRDLNSQTLRHAWRDSQGWHFETIAGPLQVAPAIAVVNDNGDLKVFYGVNNGADLAEAQAAGPEWVTTIVDGPDSPVPGHSNDLVGCAPPSALESGGSTHVFYAATPPPNCGGTSSLRHAEMDGSPPVWHFETVDGQGSVADSTHLLSSVGDASTAAVVDGQLNVFYLDGGSGGRLRRAILDGSTWTVAFVDGFVADATSGTFNCCVGQSPAAVPSATGLDLVYGATGPGSDGAGNGLTLRHATITGSSSVFETVATFPVPNYPPPGSSGGISGSFEAEPDEIVAYASNTGVLQEIEDADFAEAGGTNSVRPGFVNLGGTLTSAPAVTDVPQAGASGLPLFFAKNLFRLQVRSINQGWQPFSSTDPCRGSPAAVSTVTDGVAHVTVACRGRDNALWTADAVVPDSGLPVIARWRSLGGGLIASPAVAPVGNDLTYFVVGAHGYIYTRTDSRGFQRTSWTCVHQPAATVAPNGTTTFASLRSDGHVWFARYNGSWSALSLPANNQYSVGNQFVSKALVGPALAATSQTTDFFEVGEDHSVVGFPATTNRNACDGEVGCGFELSSTGSNGAAAYGGVAASGLDPAW